MKKHLFSINKRSIALIFIGIILNIVGFGIAASYSIPLYMDCIGTFLVSILLGPIAGSLVGAISVVLINCQNPIYMLYAFINIGGAVVVGIFLHKRDRFDSFRVVGSSVLAGIVMTIISTPINLIIHDGMVGNLWGDALVEMLSQIINQKTVCCIAGELLINIPDKIVTVMLLYGCITLFRKQGVYLDLDSRQEADQTRDGMIDKSSLWFCTILAASVMSLIIPANALAADTPDFMSDYSSLHYDYDDGLDSAEINAIVQAANGYVWAGSFSGLYQYNGDSFEKVYIDDRITNVITLYSDSRDYLWIGTNDVGVACYDPYSGKIRFFSALDGLASNSIQDICEDGLGNIYVATATYLCKIDAAVISNIFTENDVTYQEQPADEHSIGEPPEEILEDKLVRTYEEFEDITYVKCLTSVDEDMISGISGDGTLFLIQNDEIISTRKCEWKKYVYNAVGYEGNKNFLLGTDGDYLEILRYTQKGFVKVSSVYTAGLADMDEITYVSNYGGYFVACHNGFGFVDLEGNMQNLSRDDFDSSISNVLEDAQGNIWLSSNKQGILKLSYNPFVELFSKVGLPDAVVYSVLLDGNYLYAGTDNGVVKIDMVKMKVVQDDVLSLYEGQTVRHIGKDSKGNLWICLSGGDGLVRIDSEGQRTIFNDSTSKALGNRFRFTMELSDGRILACSADGVNYIRGNVIVKTIGKAQGLSVTKVLCAVELEDGTVRIGTDGGGVYDINDGWIKKHIGPENGLQSQVILRIVPCKGGVLYVGSNGLYYHPDGGDVRKLNNFPYTNNYDIYITDDHMAYITSSAGIFVVNEDDLINDEEEYTYSLLNNKRGLVKALNSNSFNAVEGQKFYLCGTGGILVLDLSKYEDFDQHYQIVLKSVTKDGVPADIYNGYYEIPAGLGQVQITPAILNYAISDPLVHIQMDEEEGITCRQSELETIYYSNLSYGDHKLYIQVLDYSGKYVKKESTFMIHKDAKLYEHTYYKVYLFVVISLFLGFVAWLVAKMGNMAIINSQYEQIRAAKEDAENANKAKSQFLAQMSHEIRTPINAVLGMDEMILRESNDADILGYATDIYNAGTALLALINDILDSSKIESGKMNIVPVEYSLSELVHNLVNMIMPRAQAKDLKLNVEVNPNLPRTLYGDDVRIRQIVTNILTNAVKYTITGSVTLRFDGEVKGDICVLHVEVEDTGIGIKQEDISKLFEAFERIEEDKNRQIEGTGLGINITVQLLNLMGSSLEVNSIYGTGSKFFFDLEQKVVDSSPMGVFNYKTLIMEQKCDIANEFTAENASVLVVDDNAMNRKVFRSLLKPTKVQVSEAASGAEAIALAEWQHYDFIFMDHMMPEMDGIETMKRLRQMDKCKNVPIYALTANATAGALEYYTGLGFDGFLGKPISIEDLKAVLRNNLPKELVKKGRADKQKSHRDQSEKAFLAVSADLPEVEGLDWKYAWIHIPDRDILRMAVQSFYETIDLHADRLDAMYNELKDSAYEYKMNSDKNGKLSVDAENAFKSYRIQVHSMKSSTATIGIVPLAGTAKILEFAAKDYDYDLIMSMHPGFIKEWRSYTDKLVGVFGLGFDRIEAINSDVASSKKIKGDKAMLNAMAIVLTTAIEDLDIDTADEVMDKMKGYTFNPVVDALIPKLSGAVKGLDEGLTKKIIKEMQNNI